MPLDLQALLARGAFVQGYETPALRTPRPAIFLDRDGTLNLEVNRVKTPEEFIIIDGVWDAIRLINQSGYRAILITNQAGIAMGMYTAEDLRQIHKKLATILGRHGAYLDAIYYCPHYPYPEYSGGVSELQIPCSCRKPAAGLIRKAAEEFNLDLSRSWLVGDSTVDIHTAHNAHLRSVLVETGYAGRDDRYPARPDYIAPDLESAVRLILQHARRAK
jgi:D,D-heptose 1,7-bisphosphate phosphatase